MGKHLAILKSEAIEAMFSGRKRIEGRFSKIKIDPFGKVAAGDVVLLKVFPNSNLGFVDTKRVKFGSRFFGSDNYGIRLIHQ